MQYKGHNITKYHEYQAICINGKRQLLHRVIAEDILGRKLKDTEVVHHIDHNKNNNAISNLMVFKTTADHTAFHNGAKIHREKDVWVADKNTLYLSTCPICGKTKSKGAKLCKVCNDLKKSKNIPSKQELKELLDNNYNFSQIGRKYGVTINSVKKWLKKYSLYKKQFYELPDVDDFLANASLVNSIKELCKIYNCCDYTIYRFIKELNLELNREQIICETNRKTYNSVTEAIKELFPQNKSHTLCTKIRKAAVNNDIFMGYKWNIKYFEIKKKNT